MHLDILTKAPNFEQFQCTVQQFYHVHEDTSILQSESFLPIYICIPINPMLCLTINTVVKRFCIQTLKKSNTRG